MNQNNGNGNNNENGSHDSRSDRGRTLHTARGCTYKEFLNCQPLNFKGTKGVIGLTYWFEKMEFVFHISNCVVECQVKYATYTLLGGSLTWWNSHVRTVRHDAAYEMTWKSLMKMMTEAYCQRNEIKKLENELWNLTVKGTNLASYRKHFQESALLCSRMFRKETDKIERQVDKKISMENNPKDEYVQQPPYKTQNVARAYIARPREKKEYAGTLLLCNKCKYHHTGLCTTECKNCKSIGHQTMNCRSLASATNQRASMANQRTLTCFECGKQGHYRSECPELKNQNRRNQAGRSKARERMYTSERGEADHADDIDA
uniref:CCHC-type domain-containing protein n=1 Tax=Tanacetum cinerariifolium TaxID=118510 RepID=A0A6L2JG91_TANCI|nr:hypothetical protein [Tanacetum cinerariifolium]